MPSVQIYAWCNITSLLTANSHTLRSGEHTRPRSYEDTDSYTVQLDFNSFMHF